MTQVVMLTLFARILGVPGALHHGSLMSWCSGLTIPRWSLCGNQVSACGLYVSRLWFLLMVPATGLGCTALDYKETGGPGPRIGSRGVSGIVGRMDLLHPAELCSQSSCSSNSSRRDCTAVGGQQTN